MCQPHVRDAADVRFLFLPRDHDPDSYVRDKGGEAFNDLALEASPLEGFFLASAMRGCQLEYAKGWARLVATAAPRLNQINAPAMLHRILAAIAMPSKFSVDELIDLCGLMCLKLLIVNSYMVEFDSLSAVGQPMNQGNNCEQTMGL